MLGSLVKCSAGGSGGGGASGRDEKIGVLAREIAEQAPELMDLRSVLEKHPIMYEESMNTVLSQEVVRFNKLIKVVRESLDGVQNALVGLVVMSADLEMMANSLFLNQVPKIWEEKAYPSLKPLAAWFQDLLERVNFIHKWIEHDKPPAYWISGFYFPQAFLTGTLQNYARKYKIPIDTLSYNFSIMNRKPEDLTEGPEDGCYIYGLFVEGARFDWESGLLAESRQKELYTEMCPMWLQPCSDRTKPKTGIYDCPVYKTLQRAGVLSTTGHSTNFVLAVELPSDKDQLHWILRGTALFAALDY
jgi:dynein heavy chain